jgi:hypothetical protein
MMNPIKYLPAVNDPVVIQVGANIEVARLTRNCSLPSSSGARNSVVVMF